MSYVKVGSRMLEKRDGKSSVICGGATMKRGLITLVVATCAVAGSGKVVYENDFSTRTSANAIPTSDWYEIPYSVGILARDYKRSWGSDNTPYENQNETQDGWALANYGTPNSTGDAMAPAYVSTNTVQQVPEGDSSNQFFEMHGNGSKAGAIIATHPIGNDFTNGTVRFTADIRSPGAWVRPENSDRQARVMPLYRSQMNALNWGGGGGVAPVQFGLQWRHDKGQTRPYLMSGTGDSTETAKNNHIETVDCNMGRDWYRFVVDVNLDTRKLSYEIYNLGARNPALETPNGTAVASGSNLWIYKNLTPERGAISGIGIFINMTQSDENNVTNSACFDNLTVSWKAPGTTDFLRCYENDFTTRRSRTLCPSGTLSSTYTPADETSTTDQFSGYADGKKVVPDINDSIPNNSPQPLGIDNWRRFNNRSGKGNVYANNFDENYGRALRFSKSSSGSFAILTQPLGEEIANGKVCISADVRLPDKWYWTTARSVFIRMGTVANATTNGNDHIGAVGIKDPAPGSSPDTTFYPFSGSTTGTTNCKPINWYRIVQTANMVTKKFDCAIYHLVSGEIDGDPVYTAKSVDFEKQIEAIGSFTIAAYGQGNDDDEAVYFDNLKVWKNYGEANETLIYSNNFTTRQRTFMAGRLNVAPVIHRPDSGIDFWARRASATANAFVQTAENPALAIVHPSQYTYVFHPFGSKAKRGRTLKFRIDIRPSKQWTWNTSQGCAVFMGDDVFMQGIRSKNVTFDGSYSVQFGFSCASAAANAYNVYEGSKAYCYSGSTRQSGVTATESHWYRFCVTAEVGAPTYSVKVYDMGALHPEMATPDGELVGLFDDLAYKNGGSDKGISGFALAAFGAPGFSPWNPDDPDAALFDNIRAEIEDKGLVLVFK